jgi:hypothetical protein
VGQHWSALAALMPLYRSISKVVLGDGERIGFWMDDWAGCGALCHALRRCFPMLPTRTPPLPRWCVAVSVGLLPPGSPPWGSESSPLSSLGSRLCSSRGSPTLGSSLCVPSAPASLPSANSTS